jgi:hypothetical protein
LESEALELKIKEFAGKGDRVSGSILEAGYKERVDFGEIIGEYALQKEGCPVEYLPTSKAMLIYDKNGHVHIWPSDPQAVLR